MKFAVTIIRPKGYAHWAVFKETANTIWAGLNSLGHTAVRTDDLSLKDHRYIVLGSNLLPYTEIKELPEGTILYNLEQHPGWENQWMKDPRYIVWDFDQSNANRLAKLGIQTTAVLPIGYHRVLETVEVGLPKDIDVLFIGSGSPRRDAILNLLRRLKLTVEHCFGVYGPERDTLMARAKLHLNIHYREDALMEWPRIMMLMANHCLTVSEASPGQQEPIGVHCTPHKRLISTCLWWLERSQNFRDEHSEIAYQAARLMPIEERLQAALGATP